MRGIRVMLLSGACLGAAMCGVARAETLAGPYPFAVGDKFVYAYTSTDTDQAGSGSPVVTTTTYTATTKVLAAVQYSFPSTGGTVTAYPVQTTAAWTDAAGAHTLTNTEYENFVTSGAVTDDALYGYSTIMNLDEGNDITLHTAQSRVYGQAALLDELPEATGAKLAEPIAWKQIDDNYYIESSGHSNVLDRTFNRTSTGAYTSSGMAYDVAFSQVAKANGTGTYIIGPSGSQEEWSFALPQSSASGEIIPVTVTFVGKTGVNDVKDWYPGGGQPADPLTTNGAVDKGIVKIPAGCGKYAGKNARLIELSYGNLDAVDGYTLYETDGYYVINKIGRACLTVNYTRTAYDQEVTGDETSSETFSSTAGLVSEVVK